MRMTRDAYARQVWKVIEALSEGQDHVPCPHENCGEKVDVLTASVRAGTTVTCPQHGLIFRE